MNYSSENIKFDFRNIRIYNFWVMGKIENIELFFYKARFTTTPLEWLKRHTKHSIEIRPSSVQGPSMNMYSSVAFKKGCPKID